MRLAVTACILLTACAPGQSPGPGAGDLQELIAQARPGEVPDVRDVRCSFIAEEGSEWRCRYRQRASDGRWVSLETFLATDGSGWALIDGVADPYGPSSP